MTSSITNKIGKVFGVGLGWALGGPIGGILGFAFGAIFDDMDEKTKQIFIKGKPETKETDFAASLLVLSAAVIKADNKVLNAELEYVKKFYITQFDSNKAARYMTMLKELLKQEIPLRKVCLQITENVSHADRLQLLHYLYGIAGADRYVDKREVATINQIATYFNISEANRDSIKSMFYESADKYYAILNIKPKATEQEIRKAYRKLALSFHPDKIQTEDENVRSAAMNKFQQVQEAYEIIKNQRGLN